MSAKIYGLAEGQYLPQSDFSTSEGPNGGGTAQQSYLMLRSSLPDLVSEGTFAKGTTATQLDENNGVQGDWLYLDRAATTNEPHGIVRVTAYFAGFSTTASYGFDDPRAVVPTFTLHGDLGERNIIEHPEVQNLPIEERLLCQATLDGLYWWDSTTSQLMVRTVDSEGNESYTPATTQPTDPWAVTFVQLIAAGRTSFFVPNLVWEKIWEDDEGIPDADLASLGQVTPDPEGNPPELGDGRSWVLTNATQTQSGELFRNRLEWTLSDRGGWNTDIYSYSA